MLTQDYSEDGRHDGWKYVEFAAFNIVPVLTRLPAVGLILGFLYGATNIIRFGPGPNGMLRTLGQYMAGSAATFG